MCEQIFMTSLVKHVIIKKPSSWNEILHCIYINYSIDLTVKGSFSKLTERLHAVANEAELATHLEEIARLTSELHSEKKNRRVEQDRLKEENTTLKIQLGLVNAERQLQNTDILKYKEELSVLATKPIRVNIERDTQTAELSVCELREDIRSNSSPMIILPVGATDTNNTEHTRQQEEIEILKSELTRITAEQDKQTPQLQTSDEAMLEVKNELARAIVERDEQIYKLEKMEDELNTLKNKLAQVNTLLSQRTEELRKSEDYLNDLRSELVYASESTATLTKDLQAITDDHSRLQNDLQRSEKEKEVLKQYLQELQNAWDVLQTELHKSESHKGHLKHELEELQTARDAIHRELETSESDKEKLQIELEEIQKARDAFYIELKTSELEKEKMKIELTDLHNARDALQADLDAKTNDEVELRTLYNDAQKTTHDLQDRLLQSGSEKQKEDFQELQKTRDLLKTERQKADAEIKKLKKDGKDLQKENKHLQNKLKSKSDEVAKLMNDNNDTHEAHRQLFQVLKARTEDYEKLMNQYKELQKARDNSENHSVEKADIKPTTSASLHVHLSDDNMPDKVAERFTEIYNNQWIDCLEVMSSEDGSCQMLLGMCLKIYSIYAEAIDKERQKEFALLQADTELAKEFISIQERFHKESTANAITSYWTKCKEVCKSMIAHDPPIYMDTDTDKHGITFDAKLYEGYTKKGTQIDFVVWPSLYTEKNGTLLRKGVVQCK
ncbi:GRIP1-associated protein 1-like isoform X3 [Dreissena polymorpha]|uniref:GRIP1-associated protein 1-like isoform X3 n=1 Tax=Dreissena polymorpha TaxID=45954 RepID=UPI0022640C40|nr:GRIP1-associated protein 1-like isoform X3 [Dreissena polymorpha]